QDCERYDDAPLVANRAETRTDIVACDPEVWELSESLTVGDDRVGKAGGVVRRAGIGDLVVEVFELLQRLTSKYDAEASHRGAECLAARRARTSSAGTTSLGSATSSS